MRLACTGAATIKVTGTLKVASRHYKLKRVTRTMTAGRPASLRLKPARTVAKAAARALAAGKRVTAKLTVRATNKAGQSASKTVTVTLRR